MSLSQKCAKHKFNSMRTLIPEMQMWFGKRSDHKPICGKLIEAVDYEDGNMHIYYYGNEGNIYMPPKQDPIMYNVFSSSGISFSFVCNGEKPYSDFFEDACRYYESMKIYNLPISIAVNEPIDFHMAEARNMSLQNCEYNIVFVLDVDVRLPMKLVQELVDKLMNDIDNDGVFNLKNRYTTGNGLYLGHKHTLIVNGFDERFQRFWYEDTEYLMNFSKMGIVPRVYFRDFTIIDHDRSTTSPYWKHNQELFKNLAMHGR